VLSRPEAPMSIAVWRKIVSTPSGVSCGLTERTSAATPATYGDAKLVPLMVW
jgi:hypothetical protein